MPRSAGEAIPQYRKHRGSGQAVVTISGRDHYLGPHGTKTSKFEYDRLVGEWLASGRSLGYGVAQNDLTISELLANRSTLAWSAVIADWQTSGILILLRRFATSSPRSLDPR